MAIKRITAANENLTNGRDRVEAQHYWAESHGKLVANNAVLQRYHHYFSVPEAYDHEPKPTFIGISMFWREDPLALPAPPDPNRWFPVGATTSTSSTAPSAGRSTTSTGTSWARST